MTHRIMLRTPSDIANAIPKLIGFHPEDSLVIAQTGASRNMVARIDMPHDDTQFSDVRDGLMSARTQLAQGQIILACYTDDHDAFLRLAANVFDLLGSVNVAITLRVHGATCWDSFGGTFEVIEEDLAPGVAVLPSRKAIVARAESVNDAREAEQLAIDAYGRGDGASAWCYYDRALALGPGSLRLHLLKQALEKAIPPHGNPLLEMPA